MTTTQSADGGVRTAASGAKDAFRSLGLALCIVALTAGCASGNGDPADDSESGGVMCGSAGGACHAASGGASGAGGAGVSGTAGKGGMAPVPGATEWSKSFVGSADRYSVSVATDAAGNVVILGFFSGTIDLGGGALSSEGMFTGADQDWAIFVAKLDPSGKHLWSERFSGAGAAYPEAVALDGNGHVVLTGAFSGTINFEGTELTSAGGKDIFVASLDALGKPLWASAFGDGADQKANAIAVDASGNITLVGDYAGVVNFGGTALTSAGQTDAFVAQLDSSGKHRWSASFGDAALQIAESVALDDSANVFVAGGFQGAIDFGGGPMMSAGGLDVFVAKLDSEGKCQWSKSYGDAQDQLARSIAVDHSGDVALTGELSGVLDFGPIGALATSGAGGAGGESGGAGASGASTAGAAGASDKPAPGQLVSAGGTDLFLAKLDKDGKSLWASSFGDKDDQRGWGVAFDGTGDVLLTGDAPGALDLGGGALPAGHVFVASFTPLGAHRWSKRFGPGAGQGLSLSVAYPGSVPVSKPTTQGSAGASGSLGSSGGAGASGHGGSAAQTAGGSGGSATKSTPSSASGSEQLFVTGVFSDSVDFGAGQLSESGHTGPFLGRITP